MRQLEVYKPGLVCRTVLEVRAGAGGINAAIKGIRRRRLKTAACRRKQVMSTIFHF